MTDGTKGLLELVRLKILYKDLFVGLNLQELQKQTDEFCWFLIPIYTPDGLQFYSLVNQ